MAAPEIRTSPQPGYRYRVQPDDTLIKIGQRAYGIKNNQWRRIWRANETALRSGSPHIIYPGEVVLIPELPEQQALKTEAASRTIQASDPGELRMIADGVEIPVESARVMRTMDTVADAWTATIAWPEDGSDIARRVVPYAYPRAAIYLGGELLLNGVIYTVDRQKKKGKRQIDIEGFSFTVDLIDSTIKPPYEVANYSLYDRAQQLCEQVGIRAVLDDGTEVAGAYNLISADPTESCFDNLQSIAAQEGLLLSSTVSGDLLITEAHVDQRPVDTLDEDVTPLPEEYSAVFDGRARFNAYRAISQTPDGNGEAISRDESVPRSRFYTFRADETESGGLGRSAQWRRNKTIADALTIPFPVSDWYTSDGTMWRENQMVTVVSETIGVPNGFDFLTKQIEYIYGADGRSATLQLVPPQVYTKGTIEEPWEG